MATQHEDKRMPEAAKESRGRRNRQGPIVYSEVSMTIPMGGTQHIKVTIGHERTAASDTDDALSTAEKAAWAWNQKVIDRRLRLLKRMIRAIESEE